LRKLSKFCSKVKKSPLDVVASEKMRAMRKLSSAGTNYRMCSLTKKLCSLTKKFTIGCSGVRKDACNAKALKCWYHVLYPHYLHSYMHIHTHTHACTHIDTHPNIHTHTREHVL